MRIRTSHLIAGGLALALAGWLASGQLQGAGDATPDEVEAAADAPPLPSVRVRDSVAEPVEQAIQVNGKTAPARTVSVRAETSARVVGLGAERGSHVVAGQILVELDPREREAMLSEAEATLRQRELEFEAATKLGERGFQAETQVAAAGAALEAAKAALERIRIEFDHTRIRAPFAGVLEERPVEIGDFVDIGDQVALVIEQDPFLVVGEVAEREVGHLETGMAGTAELITGAGVEGQIRYIEAEADPVTRTFTVELEVPNPNDRFEAGVSAELRIVYDQAPAHRVSSSLLVLSDGGKIGVMAVDDDDRAVFHSAKLIGGGSDAVWLAGLPERLRLITVGQGFVRAGEPVEAVLEDGPQQSDDLIAERAS